MTEHRQAKGRLVQERMQGLIRDYPALWTRMMDEWHEPGTRSRAWLMYSASYLFRTGSVRWAIDPVRLQRRMPTAPAVDYVASLDELSFVLLTHGHGDHLDLQLIRSLRHLPITWIVPESLLARVRAECGLANSRIVVPRALQPLDLGGTRITPFDGMHWEGTPANGTGAQRGVPALGCLVEFGGSRWLFPGDTRTYTTGSLPDFGPVDMLFAHVWLGRGGALEAEPPLLEEFCRWCLGLRPRRIVLTHLEEFGRSSEDYWDGRHAECAVARLAAMHPSIPVVTALLGDGIDLE